MKQEGKWREMKKKRGIFFESGQSGSEDRFTGLPEGWIRMMKAHQSKDLYTLHA